MPTVLSLLDLPFDGRLLGHDLSAVVAGEDQPPDRPVLMQRRFYEDSMLRGKPVRGSKFAIRDGDWKYILAEEEGTEELYNLADDPHEVDDISTNHPDLVKEFRKRLGTITGALKKIAVNRGQEMTDEDHEAFRQLGYAK
jgi:arylsulfatase A-like enzyme